MTQDLAPTPITHKTLLVKLYIGQWTAQKQDRKVAVEVAEAHDAEKDSGLYYKRLLKSGALDAFRKNGDAARIFLYSRSMPWKDGGFRLMPSMLFDEVSNELRGFREKAEGYVEDFIRDYEHAREAAKKGLGSLFNAQDYPPTHVVRAKFAFEVGFDQVPDAGHWLVDLERDQVEELSAVAAKSLHDATVVAMRDLWYRLDAAIDHIRERLANPDKTFRNTLISNLQDLADLLPKLNFAGDPNLDKLAAEAKLKLCIHDPQDLREDEVLRKSMAAQANELLKKMHPYVAQATNPKAFTP